MGYISRDIAVITEPSQVSLANTPNFVQFASKPSVKTRYQATVKVNALAAQASATLLTITEPSGAVHAFRGTADPLLAGGSVFFISSNRSDTAENLRQALLTDRWTSANFDVLIPFTWSGGTMLNGEALELSSKGFGAEYNITLAAPDNTANAAYTITIVNGTSQNGDSISGEASTAEIELDVFTGADIFLGQEDRPTTAARLGQFAVTLQKSYAGAPLWFDVNALFAQYAPVAKPAASGWFDTGTVQAYRFIAKVKAVNSFSFYQSNALYAINGYGPAFESLDFSQYVYAGPAIKLLTNKPRTPWVRGQKEYLNFIFSDPTRGTPEPAVFTLRPIYRAYTSGGQFLGQLYGPSRAAGQFAIVNTCVLELDALLDAFPGAALFKVALVRGTAIVSNDLEYTVRPECLHKLRQFVFLNRLGGWESFNFDAGVRDEIKPSADTFKRTHVPGLAKGDSLETVYTTALANTLTVEGAPITDAVAEWLKELAAAKVIFDGEGNYIIKEDFTLVMSPTSQNMQVPTIKYRLSENYTNE